MKKTNNLIKISSTLLFVNGSVWGMLPLTSLNGYMGAPFLRPAPKSANLSSTAEGLLSGRSTGLAEGQGKELAKSDLVLLLKPGGFDRIIGESKQNNNQLSPVLKKICTLIEEIETRQKVNVTHGINCCNFYGNNKLQKQLTEIREKDEVFKKIKSLIKCIEENVSYKKEKIESPEFILLKLCCEDFFCNVVLSKLNVLKKIFNNGLKSEKTYIKDIESRIAVQEQCSQSLKKDIKEQQKQIKKQIKNQCDVFYFLSEYVVRNTLKYFSDYDLFCKIVKDFFKIKYKNTEENKKIFDAIRGGWENTIKEHEEKKKKRQQKMEDEKRKQQEQIKMAEDRRKMDEQNRQEELKKQKKMFEAYINQSDADEKKIAGIQKVLADKLDIPNRQIWTSDNPMTCRVVPYPHINVAHALKKGLTVVLDIEGAFKIMKNRPSMWLSLLQSPGAPGSENASEQVQDNWSKLYFKDDALDESTETALPFHLEKSFITDAETGAKDSSYGFFSERKFVTLSGAHASAKD